MLIKRSTINTDYSAFHRRDMSSCETLNRPVENSIRGKLEAALKPLHCDVINESYMHNVPKNSETHFKVVVVSEIFDNQPLIKASIADSRSLIARYFSLISSPTDLKTKITLIMRQNMHKIHENKKIWKTIAFETNNRK